MKTGLFSFILIIGIGFAPETWARWSSHQHCAQSLEDIKSELGKDPDDRFRGLVTHAVPLTTTTMIEAYPMGLFPWFITEMGTAAWFNPPKRGILWLDDIKFTSKELQFFRNAHKKYHWTLDGDFAKVIERCAKLRQGDTWISDDYLQEYPKLAEMGLAHSIEIWRNDNNKFAGGLYGVDINGTFTGESIVREPGEPHIDKYALYILSNLLRSVGRKWIDTQVQTPLIKQVGGKLVARDPQVLAQLVKQLDRDIVEHVDFETMRAEAQAEAKPFPKAPIEISEATSYH